MIVHRAVQRWALAGLLLLLTLGATACQSASSGTAPPVLTVGGNFTLTDYNRQKFELSSLHGKVVLIFFGYTFCPDVCPTTLSKLASVYRKLGPDSGGVKTIYISVDPERDTPEVLKAELSNFSIDAIGLTGTKAEIDKVVSLYGAQYMIMPQPDSAAKYTVAHSTTLYAVDPAGNTRILFPYEASVDDIVKGIRQILASNEDVRKNKAQHGVSGSKVDG